MEHDVELSRSAGAEYENEKKYTSGPPRNFLEGTGTNLKNSVWFWHGNDTRRPIPVAARSKA